MANLQTTNIAGNCSISGTLNGTRIITGTIYASGWKDIMEIPNGCSGIVFGGGSGLTACTIFSCVNSVLYGTKMYGTSLTGSGNCADMSAINLTAGFTRSKTQGNMLCYHSHGPTGTLNYTILLFNAAG